MCWILVLLMAASVTAFAPSIHTCSVTTGSQLSATTKTTMTEETTWTFRLLLNGIPTEKGKKIDQLFVIQAQFIEDEGYEPPQGSLKQIKGDLQLTKSRWILSEDPDNRKDGLWVWGLFSEPLYPFLLLNLETGKFDLPGEDGDSVLPLKLFAQINHKRDEEKGVLLSQAELNVREIETVKADPIGAATVDVYEEVAVGQITIQAT
mmetsp:Transcript_4543/g.8361  ORF Transcript_4543/g.8361 Transcript_4543/m.8361 type:complete len:206 (+) Transcript_4543:80-697(+)